MKRIYAISLFLFLFLFLFRLLLPDFFFRCVLFTDCLPTVSFFASGLGVPIGTNAASSCGVKYPNQTNCEEEGGEWLSLPLSSRRVCEDIIGGTSSSALCEIGHGAPSPKNPSMCRECGGKVVAPAEWIPGEWISGTSERGEWSRAAMMPAYYHVDDTISFMTMNDMLVNASKLLNLYLSYTDYACRVYPFLNYYSLFACDCSDPLLEDRSLVDIEQCNAPLQQNLANTGSFTMGAMFFCPDQDIQTGLLIGNLVSFGQDILGRICLGADTVLAPADVFIGNRKR